LISRRLAVIWKIEKQNTTTKPLINVDKKGNALKTIVSLNLLFREVIDNKILNDNLNDNQDERKRILA